MSDHLIEHCDKGVTVLTLNRPERMNALSRPMLADLLTALERLAADQTVGVVVLTGTDPAFCAGGDVKAMTEDKEFHSGPLEHRTQTLRGLMECSRWLHEMPKPTIAMVNGAAAGAGLSIALACDMRLAGTSAMFTTAFAHVGFSGDFGGSYFLTHLVGTAKARELYFTAAKVGAEEALGLGMVNKVIADADLAAETMALAERLAAGPTVAYRYMKRNMNAALGLPLAQVMDIEALHHTRTGETEDHKEAAQAFVEKRPPVFRGR